MDYGRQLREMKDYLMEVKFFVFLSIVCSFHLTPLVKVILIITICSFKLSS